IDNARVLIDNNLIFSLFKKIEKAKTDLSNQTETFIEFSKETIEIRESFNLPEFETIISQHTKEIEQYILNLLQSVSYGTDDIDAVFITGGSSLVVPVRNILYRIFGQDKIRTGDTFNSVAYGLSISN
ncbi:MAG: Hsp70 family protein, partial [Bacteroides sp.]